MDGFELYARGSYWEAHEVWEVEWRAAPLGSPERARLAGLIQLCAAVVQSQRGRWRGVATLVSRATHNLESSGAHTLAGAVVHWGTAVVAMSGWREPPDLCGVRDADAYRRHPSTSEELGSNAEPMDWDAEGWET